MFPLKVTVKNAFLKVASGNQLSNVLKYLSAEDLLLMDDRHTFVIGFSMHSLRSYVEGLIFF